ncbi:hypothetical protein GDO81_006576 [Engystomops pustulosus]|uniref:Uncharacterized protein n=1 Tax=Engystomops pustulosus TaxID=76066 RepID=A0AAV7CZ38_ENGPU|nr:hypothetical protein GDO81_006576 [Engystomops pustulosus]
MRHLAAVRRFRTKVRVCFLRVWGNTFSTYVLMHRGRSSESTWQRICCICAQKGMSRGQCQKMWKIEALGLPHLQQLCGRVGLGVWRS